MFDDIVRPPSLGPFTAAKLRRALDGVLTRAYRKPSFADLEWLARNLNQIHGVFNFATTTANEGKLAADRVGAALVTLELFFKRRRQSWFPETNGGATIWHVWDGPLGTSAENRQREAIESERKLYDQFQSFMRAFETHPFELDIDAAQFIPHIENWRPLAEWIADAFRSAMSRNNSKKKFGLSNDGPVPRFVAAVIPFVTGETPTILNVGKHLKDMARETKERQTGTIPA